MVDGENGLMRPMIVEMTFILGQDPTQVTFTVDQQVIEALTAAGMALVRYQMRRIARGDSPRLGTHPARALACDQLAQRRALRRYRSWLRTSA
jgi:hypothetical protein